MKKTRKGLTLVEVIVSIAVFTIISLALFTSFLGMRKVVAKQEEYVRIEMVCYDINYYWDMYGNDWDNQYFDGESNGNGKGYLQYKDGILFPNRVDGNYEVKWLYYKIEDDKVIILGENYVNDAKLLIEYIKSDDRVFVENVYCGGQGE